MMVQWVVGDMRGTHHHLEAQTWIVEDNLLRFVDQESIDVRCFSMHNVTWWNKEKT